MLQDNRKDNHSAKRDACREGCNLYAGYVTMVSQMSITVR
jgi:hypothetical protein